MWLDVPDMLSDLTRVVQPRVPRKYRITVNCSGFSPSSIKTRISDDKSKLIVQAQEGLASEEIKNKGPEEDYNTREFRRTFKLPSNVNSDELVSFMTSNGTLVIEIPYKTEEAERESLLPQLVDDEEKEGHKCVKMSISLPENINTDNVKVTCKDRDVIVQAEDKQDTEDKFSRVFFYRRFTLPENTNFKELKCSLDNNKLTVKAPVEFQQRADRDIPIQRKEAIKQETTERAEETEETEKEKKKLGTQREEEESEQQQTMTETPESQEPQKEPKEAERKEIPCPLGPQIITSKSEEVGRESKRQEVEQ
jgi:HSP20 family molecular chaperone IbpA